MSGKRMGRCVRRFNLHQLLLFCAATACFFARWLTGVQCCVRLVVEWQRGACSAQRAAVGRTSQVRLCGAQLCGMDKRVPCKANTLPGSPHSRPCRQPKRTREARLRSHRHCTARRERSSPSVIWPPRHNSSSHFWPFSGRLTCTLLTPFAAVSVSNVKLRTKKWGHIAG